MTKETQKQSILFRSDRDLHWNHLADAAQVVDQPHPIVAGFFPSPAAHQGQDALVHSKERRDVDGSFGEESSGLRRACVCKVLHRSIPA